MDLFADVSVSVHSPCQISHVLPKTTTEEQMREFTLALFPLAVFTVVHRHTRHSLLLRLAPRSQFAWCGGERSEGPGLGEPAPQVHKCPLAGDQGLLHKQGLACGDSIHNEFSHPRLQTLGIRLKNGISKQPRRCMNGGSVIIRN